MINTCIFNSTNIFSLTAFHLQLQFMIDFQSALAEWVLKIAIEAHARNARDGDLCANLEKK